MHLAIALAVNIVLSLIVIDLGKLHKHRLLHECLCLFTEFSIDATLSEIDQLG